MYLRVDYQGKQVKIEDKLYLETLDRVLERVNMHIETLKGLIDKEVGKEDYSLSVQFWSNKLEAYEDMKDTLENWKKFRLEFL